MLPNTPKRQPDYALVNGKFGKRIYDLVAKHLAAGRPRRGTVLLKSGEIEAVRKFLCDLKDGKIAATAKPTRGPLKRAKLTLASVSKFVSNGKRTIRGVANSGLTDRVGDIVEPKGGQWDLPVPLLW